MKRKKAGRKSPAHALFWALLKETPGYRDEYREVVKEGVVHRYSGGRTTSLAEMYRSYPAEYSEMIEAMKGSGEERKIRYEAARDKAAKRVIAAICAWIDKAGYRFGDSREKIRYAISVACRAANCPEFDKIPESRLTAIYSLFCRKNEVDFSGNPEVEHVPSRN